MSGEATALSLPSSSALNHSGAYSGKRPTEVLNCQLSSLAAELCREKKVLVAGFPLLPSTSRFSSLVIYQF